MTTKERIVSPEVSAVIGAVAGTVEVCIQQPTVSWKNSLQQKLPLSLNPTVIYRGTVINAASIAPICGIQFGVNSLAQKWMSKNGTRKLSRVEIMGGALVAGTISCLCAGPAELLMIQQQKGGGSLAAVASRLVKQHGVTVLGKGMVPCIGRDSLYTAGYLALAPLLKNELRARLPSLFPGEVPASLAASICSGLVAASLTQPFDTIKTMMQGDITGCTRPSTTLISVLRQPGGFSRLYSGFLPRCARIVGAVFILSEVRTRLNDLYLKHVAE